jgi:homoserine O-acetyltransferase
MEKNLVETLFFDFPDEFHFRDGTVLSGVRIAYETWGRLNADRSNAILLYHALSGSHHASGYNSSIEGVGEYWQPEMHDGWWEDMIGPGKALDTNQYFIICSNYLGGCYGSTGPSSLNARSQQPWGADFPRISAADQVAASAHLLDHLGIETLIAVIGPSVGGLLALTFATTFPKRVRKVISIAAGFKTTVLNRLILFEQVLAIENDPNFQGGNYYADGQPTYGLALARMISHKTFVHLDAIEKRARQDIVQDKNSLSWFRVQDQVQSYMLHQGKKFVRRFDANTYLRIIDMWSCYDAVHEAGACSPRELLERCADAGQHWLVFSIDSDFCFYPEEQADLTLHLERADLQSTQITVHSDKGHDSFLLEPHLYSPHISWLLGS